MKRRTLWLAAVGGTVALVYAFCAPTLGGAKHLADGSNLKIWDARVAEKVSYNFTTGNWAQRFLGRIVPRQLESSLPWSIRSKWLPSDGAGLNMSGEGKVCLFIVTARSGLQRDSKLNLKFVVVSDEPGEGTNDSPCQVTVDSAQRFQGWCLEDFPRKSRILHVRCLASGQEGQLAEVAQFVIRNPANCWFSN